MKPIPILGALLLIPAIALFAVICGVPPGRAQEKRDTDINDIGKTSKQGKKAAIEATLDATVKGIVKFKGTQPKPKPNAVIAQHADTKKGNCGRPTDQLEQVWTISKDGGVANVIISLGPPGGKEFKKFDENLLEAYKHPVIIDQPFCQFIPHVVAIYGDYQPLIARNSAKMLHNVKIEAGAERGGTKDFVISPGRDSGEMLLMGGPESIINVSCSIHAWMYAKIGVFNHPYFAVTDKDGKFEIKNVPIDTPLTVYMWHESNPTKVDVQKLTAKTGDNELKLAIGAK